MSSYHNKVKISTTKKARDDLNTGKLNILVNNQSMGNKKVPKLTF